MTEIEGEGIESLVRRFKRATQQSGIIQELRTRSAAMSKSEDRRRKDLRAARRARKAQRRHWHDDPNNEHLQGDNLTIVYSETGNYLQTHTYSKRRDPRYTSMTQQKFQRVA